MTKPKTPIDPTGASDPSDPEDTVPEDDGAQDFPLPPGHPHQPRPSDESMMRAMLEACCDAIEEQMDDVGYIVILATAEDYDAPGSGSTAGTMRYLSNLTKESRDHLLNTILAGEEPPHPPHPVADKPAKPPAKPYKPTTH